MGDGCMVWSEVWAGAETGMRTDAVVCMCRMGWAGDYVVGGWCVCGVFLRSPASRILIPNEPKSSTPKPYTQPPNPKPYTIHPKSETPRVTAQSDA